MTAEIEGQPSLQPMNKFGHALPYMSSVREWLVLVAAAIGFYLCYRLSLPFLSALTWALVLAILLVPLHRRLELVIPKADISAFVSVTATAIAAGIPLFLVVQQLVQEAAGGAAYLQGRLGTLEWGDFLGNHPRVAEVGTWIGQRLDAAGTLGALARWLTEQSTTLLRGSLNQVVGLILTFYMLFYFLRDRENGLKALVAYSPLTEAETTRVAFRFVETVRASIFGTVVVGFVQGSLGGMMFWWLGLPTPVFWGFVMGVLAIFPFLGAFVVWVPAAAILVLQGEWGNAAILALWGGVIIATVDNLLYPILVGNRLRLHTLATFIGMVGGIILFGAAGIVLGPAVIAVTLELVEIVTLRSKLGQDMLRQNQTVQAPGEP